MEHNVRLKIGRIVLSVEEKPDGSKVEKTLRQAMEILVHRLKKAPAEGCENLSSLVLQRLETEPLSEEEMFSSRGAWRLADDLYRQIIGGR